MEEQLSKFPVKMEIAVQWGEMDAARHVNNTVYLQWSESVRIKYFEDIGIDTSFAGQEVGPILGWQDCKYIFPMSYPDTAIIGCRTSEIKSDRLILETAIFSKTHQRIAAISLQSIIPYSYIDFAKLSLPDKWLDAIKVIEKNSSI